METHIPPELLEMLRQRRVIPFIGAGFSAGHALPDWDTLLRQVSSEIPDIPEYDTIKQCCNGDNLQIAEYLYIKSDRSIGPLRHKLSSLLQTRRDYLTSTPHIELINLNPRQIYTTNYDEIIEQTYKRLGHPYAFVALPKHIAGANKDRTQVIKYHGDLRYDQSLVLTESSYYNRLEFESPMDLKFRSDLLGQSVLFIGYSFRDINIRIIWFKLMEMMRDVPESDRPSSFIVRFEKNEILEDLYRAVGIKTICLDPNSTANSPEERNHLLGEFMLDLAIRTTRDGHMPQSQTSMYMSPALLAHIQKDLSARTPIRIPGQPDNTILLIEHAALRQVPPAMLSAVDRFLGTGARMSRRSDYLSSLVKWAARYLSTHNVSSPGACFAIIKGLLRESSREALMELGTEVPWELVWSTKLGQHEAEALVKAIESEAETHGDFDRDYDIAYAADVAIRMLKSTLAVQDLTSLAPRLTEALKKAVKLYPAIELINPAPKGITDLHEVLDQIKKASEEDDEDIPF